MTIFYLIRHGDTQKNQDGQYDFDPSLTDLGKQQAKDLSLELSNIKFDRYYTSTKSRAVQTALFFTGHNNKITIDPAIVEARGPFVAQNHDGNSDLEKEDTFMALKTENEKLEYISQQGSESPSLIAKRMYSFLKKLSIKYPTKTIAVFSHTFSIRILLVYLKQSQVENIFDVNLKNCGYAVLSVSQGKIIIKDVVGLV